MSNQNKDRYKSYLIEKLLNENKTNIQQQQQQQQQQGEEKQKSSILYSDKHEIKLDKSNILMLGPTGNLSFFYLTLNLLNNNI